MTNPSEQATVEIERLLENTYRETKLDLPQGLTVHHLLDGSSETWIREDQVKFHSASNDRNVYLEKRLDGTGYRVVKEVKKRADPGDKKSFLREVTSMITCTQKTVSFNCEFGQFALIGLFS